MNKSVWVAFCLCMAVTEVVAFHPAKPGTLARPLTAISSTASGDDATSTRRQLLFGALGAAAALGTTTAPAEASYSAYTNREKDWQQRQSKGEIQYSTASSLKSQLREIAPMNTESSRIFCPNGPSAAVTPLMENKCGDRMAMPSVYGRTTGE